MDTIAGEPVFWAVTLVCIVSFVIGRRWGYRVLVECLFAEGYTITMDSTREHGNGRFVVTKAKEPPF